MILLHNLHLLFQDILENDDMQLDDMFIASLIYDILRVGTLYFIIDEYCETKIMMVKPKYNGTVSDRTSLETT